jgi:hypothetical protein
MIRLRAIGFWLAMMLTPAMVSAATTSIPLPSLPNNPTPVGSDLIPDQPNGSLTLKYVTLDQIKGYVAGGSVTSVGLTLPSPWSCTGSPVTGAGIIACTVAVQSANTIYAGPSSGSPAAPAFRALVAADLPASGVTPGTCTSCNLTFDVAGRITVAANGSGGGGAPAGSVNQLQTNAGSGSFGYVPSSDGLNAFAINPVRTGLEAEYPILDGSGSSVADISGNGATATLSSATPPTWTTYGIFFQAAKNANVTVSYTEQYVQTPIATWKTAIVNACVAPLPQTSGNLLYGPYFSTYPTILAPSTNSDGLMLIVPTVATHSGAIFPAVYAQNGGSFNTTAQSPAPEPCATIAITLDTADHIYIDGVEIAYAAQGASSSKVTTTGSYRFGSNGPTPSTNYFMGSINYLEFYSGVLTPTQIAQEAQYINYKVRSRPGFPLTSRASTNTPQIICIGDSLTAAATGSPWCLSSVMTTTNTYGFSNWGIGSDQPNTDLASGAIRYQTAISPVSGGNICNIFEGTNSFADSTFTPLQVWDQLQALGRQARAAGCNRVIVDTMISRNGYDTSKNAYNALIRAGWRQTFDAMADFGAIPGIGADGAYRQTSSPACFYSDGIHLSSSGTCATYAGSSIASYPLLGAVLANEINALDGSTPYLPSTTACPSNVYTEGFADTYLLATPTAACTITFPDATGQTGMKRSLINNSAFSITVVGATEYYGNGSSAGAAPIVGSTTIAANSTAEFTSMLAGTPSDPLPNLTSAISYQWLRTK